MAVVAVVAVAPRLIGPEAARCRTAVKSMSDRESCRIGKSD
jgi:hypothetical protein